MSRPPSAGPASRSATGRTNWSSEFARASSEAGRTSGTIASNAGPKNAAPAPYRATRATTCHSSSMPVIDSSAMAATATPRVTSAASITRRRSRRSETTPPSSRNAIVGIVIAMPTSASAVGAFDSA